MVHLATLLISVFIFTFLPGLNKADKPHGPHTARCTGSANCRACSSCNYCGHCNSGGSCGVCGGGSKRSTISSPRSNTYSYPSRSSSSGGSLPRISTTRMYRVKADQLNIRSGPGSDFSVIGVMGEGEIIPGTILPNSSWVKISHTALNEEGDFITQTGYVSKSYLAPL